MGRNWIITSKVHIKEIDFHSWQNSSAEFIHSDIELFNCDTTDDFVQKLVSGDLKAPYSSIGMFYANELTDMTLSFDKETLLVNYDKDEETLNIALQINREKGLNTAVYNVAMLLSIIPFKHNNIKDLCLISEEDFYNLKYAIEFDNKNIKLIKKLAGDTVIPERYEHIYKLLNSPDTVFQNLDTHIHSLFTNLIAKRLETDIEDIILFSTPEHPATITHDAMYKTDGKYVLTSSGEIVNGADPKTFMSLSQNYGMDQSNIFYKTEVLKNADVGSFFVLSWGYAKDKNYAYFQGQPICEIKSNFRTLRPARGYATNNTIVFYNGKPLQASDYMTFRAIGDTEYNNAEFLTTDTLFLYYNGEIIDHIDLETVESIGKNFFRDKNGVYFLSQEIDGLFPEKSTVLNEFYIADDLNAVYADNENITVLEDAVPAELTVKGRFAYDKTNVYFKGQKIEGLDGSTVKIEKPNFKGYLTDKNSVYYYTTKVDADPKTFKALDFGYGTDGSHLFFKDTIIKEGNFTSTLSLFDSIADTCAIFDNTSNIDLGSGFKKLQNNIYYYSHIIQGADSKTFENCTIQIDNTLVYSDYAKDSNNVYYKDTIVKEADSSTFKLLVHPEYNNYPKYTPALAMDKNHIFYQGKSMGEFDTSDIKPFHIYRAWVAGNTLIYKGKITKDVDIDNFHQLEENFYTDNKAVFYKGIKIDKINPETMMILSNNYIKDDIMMCYIEENTDGNCQVKLFEPHINSFDIVGENEAFSFDRFNIYFKGRVIEYIDMKSISFIGDNYLMDKTSIYCGDTKIDADLGMFMLLGEGYASDGKNTFYQNKNLNTTTMIHVLGNGYATDGAHFWLYGEIIENPYEHQFITDVLGQGFA